MWARLPLVEAVLPLHHHAQVLVVQQQHLDRQLLAVKQQASSWMFMRKLPSPSMSMTGLAGMGGLCPHGRGQAEAHRPQTAAGEPAARRVEMEILGRPHLMLADARGDDGIVELAALVE